jgi:hypothetical protein
MLEKEFDYLLWYDIDCQLRRHDIKLEYFIEKHFTNPETRIVLTMDKTTFNTGVMFLKKSDFVIDLMTRAFENTNEFDKSFWDQTSMEDIYKRDESIRKYINIIPYGHLKDELVVFWSQFDPEKSFILHCARCSQDRLGFYYMMDLYYIFKLDEESEEEYNTRLDWINNKSVIEIQQICNNIYVPRRYSRRVKNIFNLQ